MRIIDANKIPRERRYKLGDDFKDIKQEFIIDKSEVDIGIPFRKNGIIYSACQIHREKGWQLLSEILYKFSKKYRKLAKNVEL